MVNTKDSTIFEANPFFALHQRLLNIESQLSTLLDSKDEQGYFKTIETESDEQFDIEGLSKYLNCTKVTIHRYKKKGVFPYYQVGRTVYFKKSEVDRALASKKQKGARV